MNSGRDNIATYETRRNSMGEPSSTVNRGTGSCFGNIVSRRERNVSCQF